MTTSLPLSPAVTAQLQTSLDVQRALYQLATLPDFGAVQPLLQEIRSTVEPLRPLHHLQDLLSTDPAAAAQALCEIANIKKGDGLLTALREDTCLRDRLGSTAARLTVQTKPVRDGLESWSASMPAGLARRTGFSLGRLWAGLNYWAGWPAAFSGAAGALGLLGLEISNLIATGQFDPARLAEATGALGGAAYLAWQRGHASKALTVHAEHGTIEHEHIREFFDRYRGPFPFERIDLDRLGPNRDILDDIRRSSGTGGPLTISKRTTYRLLHDFITLGQVTNRSFKKDPSQVLYDRLAQAIGMGTLERLGWQPAVLHPERLEELRERKRQGRKLIFVGNHRSHLDILALVALFRDFRVRFPAKKDLTKVPVLKDLLAGANHPIIDRKDAGGRYKSLLRQGMPLLERGLSLYIFAEGTRSPTRNRAEEVGLLPFELGAFGLALQYSGGVDIVPICNYGLGRALPGEDSQAWEEGTMTNPPVVISVGEPIEIESFTNGGKAGTAAKIRLANQTWSRMWNELSAIQALMNNSLRP